jgi:hypothetical protein
LKNEPVSVKLKEEKKGKIDEVKSNPKAEKPEKKKKIG